MTKPVIFLDDGGVLNDNAVRGPQWQRLVGEYFAPRLGGAPAAWARANAEVITELLTAPAWEALLRGAADYAAFERAYYGQWLGDMCNRVGVARPPEAECLALSVAAEAYIMPRVRSAMRGAVEGVRALHAAGCTLHTASGEGSRALNLYLAGMGLRACFGRLYGPDLIGTFKLGPDYYARILADVGLQPEAALFVDDSPKALGWARQTGARTVLVGREDVAGFERVESLVELAGRLAGG